ncbi:type II toxin-antitoxin system RelE/ParE family toxin [Thiotrichales bacterium 19S9-12]|nr:type II toxin-antitoxin system RelE/ParE family toxin [Thiotrichales bacterium 19S9-11]MCF6811721.1 type II toxin-antitoxin system RelE/ParE family toxin [Thiotrichales bacterium 19S9-12]
MLQAFYKWAKKEKIEDEVLVNAAIEVTSGLHDGDLGSGCFKKRIAAKGKGKRGGARTILSYKVGDRVIYIYAYAKNEKATLTSQEQKALKAYSKDVLMKLNEKDIDLLISKRELKEVRL